MKKLSWGLILAMLMAIFSFQNALVLGAGEGQVSDKKIEITFAVGDSVLTINGEKVTVQTPYVVDGVTLVPVRVITEAFGAQVDWDNDTQTATVTYSEVTIKLTIGNKIATINGMPNELLAAPELTNDTTMLPLRFITESFGADVAYEPETEKITVVKEITQSNSIKDYAMILKRSTKEKVGDSYLKWSMKRTPDFKLRHRSFDGYMNLFASEEAGSIITLIIQQPPKDETIDDYLEDLRKAGENATTIELKKDTTKGGTPYAHIQFKTKDTYVDYRTFVTDGLLFNLSANVPLEKGTKGFEVLCELLDTFECLYKGSEAEDLSDVDSSNMHTFVAKDFGLKVSIPGNYRDLSKTNTTNEFRFALPSDYMEYTLSSVRIGFFSAERDKNYKTYAEKDRESNRAMLNPELCEVSEIRPMTVDNKAALYYESTVNLDNRSEYDKDVFIDCGDYWCNISITVQNDSASKELMNKILSSVTIGEIDKEKVGKVIRSKSGDQEEIYKSFRHDALKLSVEAPNTWLCQTPATAMILYDDNTGRDVAVSSFPKSNLQGGTLSDYVNYVKENVGGKPNITMISRSVESKRELGQNMLKFTFKEKNDNDRSLTGISTIYFFEDGNTVYSIQTYTPEYLNGEKTKEIFEKIISSFMVG